jgi:hypothetical protein
MGAELILFGLPGALVGFTFAFWLRPRHLAAVAAALVLVGAVFGTLGTTADGETAGGWLGFIVVGFQLLGFAGGVAMGLLLRRFRRDHPTLAA